MPTAPVENAQLCRPSVPLADVPPHGQEHQLRATRGRLDGCTVDQQLDADLRLAATTQREAQALTAQGKHRRGQRTFTLVTPAAGGEVRAARQAAPPLALGDVRPL